MVTPTLVPREHGAYAELLLPLFTGLALGRPGLAAALFAASAVLAFLFFEPIAVLAGYRGSRVRRRFGRDAQRRMITLGIALVATGGTAMITATAEARLAALIPLAGAAALLPAGRRGRIKTIGSELLVAATLTAALLPVALAGGARWSYSLAAAFVWVLSFALGTVTVHAIKARAQGIDHARRMVVGAPLLAGLAIAIGTAVASTEGWSRTAGLALLPPGVAALTIGLARVHPRQLRTVGWSLVAANLATAALLIAGR